MAIRDTVSVVCRRISSKDAKRLVWTSYIWLLVLTQIISPVATLRTWNHPSWQRPGCHRVGHTRQVQIADCVVFNVTLNACRGFCESFAIPSPSRTLNVNDQRLITSRAECCSIKQTHDVKYVVDCVEGVRVVTFKSAKSCSCSICRK